MTLFYCWTVVVGATKMTFTNLLCTPVARHPSAVALCSFTSYCVAPKPPFDAKIVVIHLGMHSIRPLKVRIEGGTRASMDWTSMSDTYQRC